MSIDLLELLTNKRTPNKDLQVEATAKDQVLILGKVECLDALGMPLQRTHLTFLLLLVEFLPLLALGLLPLFLFFDLRELFGAFLTGSFMLLPLLFGLVARTVFLLLLALAQMELGGVVDPYFIVD